MNSRASKARQRIGFTDGSSACDCSASRRRRKLGRNNRTLLVRGNNGMSVVVTFGESGKIKKLHWLVAGIDVGVYGRRIRRQHVGHARLLDTQFGPHQYETGAV